MATKTKPNSELDEYFPREGAANDAPVYDMEAELAKFSAELNAALDELLPNNVNLGKRKAMMVGAWGTSELSVLFEKNTAEHYIGLLNAFIAKVEKRAQEAAKPASKTEPAKTETAPLAESASDPQGQVDKPVNLDKLAEAPFSATVKIYHKVYGVEVLLTVRSNAVQDGIKRLETTLDWALGENGKYSANRSNAPEQPSMANRRVTGQEPAAAPKQTEASAPVRSFDPDADNKPKTEILHQKVIEIEKVAAQDGKIQINLYVPGKPKFPEFYLKSDADKEEVWKHINVDAMELAKRYAFKATVDYVLSNKLNSKGNPYKNLRAIRPE